MGESMSTKKSIVDALRGELEDLAEMELPRQTRGDTDKFLAGMGDGTYPILPTEDEVQEVAENPRREAVAASSERGRPSGGNEEPQDMMAFLREIHKSQQEMDRRMSRLERGEPRQRGNDELLGSVLQRASGGQIRARQRRQRDDSEAESDESGGESENDDEATERDQTRNSRFWRDFKKVRFPVQTLRYEKRVGEKLLRRALECHPTVAAYVGDKAFKQVRNGKESRVIARAVDCMIDDFGITNVRKSQAAEVLMRRLAAILLADRTGSWDAADELVSEDTDLLDESMKKRIHKSAKLAKEFGKRKPAKEVGEEK